MVLGRRFRIAGVSIGCVWLAAVSAWAQQPSDWLPPETLLVVKVDRPSELVSLVEQHVITQGVLELPQVREGLKSDQYREFKKGLAMAEIQFDATWQELLARAAGGGVTLAIRDEPQGAVAFLESESAEAAQSLLATGLKLASAGAKANDQPDPVKKAEYREQTVYGIGPAKITTLDRWIVVTNENELGKSIIDAFLEPTAECLSQNTKFQTAWQRAPQEAQLWAYLDVVQLRESGKAADVFQSRTDNPIAELLFGGLLDIAANVSTLELSMNLAADRIAAKFSTDWKPEWVSESRSYFWGQDGNGRAGEPLQVANTIVNLSSYRDSAEMWLRAGDLMKEDAVDGLAQAESVLSTLFLGKDFAEDILASFQPQADILVVRRDFAPDQPQPAIKLPGFGIVFEFNDAETMRPQFRRIFQSLIGFINVTGAMNGQPQLELDMQKEGDLQTVWGEYLVDTDRDDPASLPIQYNFSPTVAFQGSRFVLASNLDLATELAQATRNSVDAEASTVVNTRLTAAVDQVARALADNREQLVAQNMLEEGSDREEAELAIDTLFKLVGLFRQAELSLGHDDEQVSLELQVLTAAESVPSTESAN